MLVMNEVDIISSIVIIFSNVSIILTLVLLSQVVRVIGGGGRFTLKFDTRMQGLQRNGSVSFERHHSTTLVAVD